MELGLSLLHQEIGSFSKVKITRCDLSPRFFCIDATLCANLKAIRYESMSLNIIVADKSHRVMVD